VRKDREEAQAIMQKLGYGPNSRLPVKIATRNLAVYRDPAAILIDQLKEVYVDGELETVETANWVPKLIRKDFKVGLNVLGTAVDDPDVYFYQNYVCSSARNYPGYCDKGFDAMVDRQSLEANPAERQKLAWDIDYKLQRDLARPVIYHLRAATCWQPQVKGLTMMTNSQYNGWRFEDIWLER
jgi:peptide/nickel transport system substrate-binding protein